MKPRGRLAFTRPSSGLVDRPSFYEAHAYSTEPANPLLTLVHLVASLSLYTPVVLASVTLPDAVREHLKKVAERNGVVVHEVTAPPRPKKLQKAMVELDAKEPTNVEDLVGRMVDHVKKLISKGYRAVLVRAVTPEVAYRVYSSLTRIVNCYSLGVLHGRIPILDRERAFRVVREG